jgi:hypothetical protein
MPLYDTKLITNPHNPNPGFDEDWEVNWSPGFMGFRFPAVGMDEGCRYQSGKENLNRWAVYRIL